MARYEIRRRWPRLVKLTDTYSLPYPEMGDPLYKGADQIRDLAQKLEDTLLQTGAAPADSDLDSIESRLDNIEGATTITEEILSPSSGFSLYKTSYPIKLIRSGNTVTISGALTTSNDLSKQDMFEIPSKHIPERTESSSIGSYFGWLFQGSGDNFWYGYISSNGHLKGDRYGPGDIGSKPWLPFVFTYNVGEK